MVPTTRILTAPPTPKFWHVGCMSCDRFWYHMVLLQCQLPENVHNRYLNGSHMRMRYCVSLCIQCLIYVPFQSLQSCVQCYVAMYCTGYLSECLEKKWSSNNVNHGYCMTKYFDFNTGEIKSIIISKGSAQSQKLIWLLKFPYATLSITFARGKLN